MRGSQNVVIYMHLGIWQYNGHEGQDDHTSRNCNRQKIYSRLTSPSKCDNIVWYLWFRRQNHRTRILVLALAIMEQFRFQYRAWRLISYHRKVFIRRNGLPKTWAPYWYGVWLIFKIKENKKRYKFKRIAPFICLFSTQPNFRSERVFW